MKAVDKLRIKLENQKAFTRMADAVGLKVFWFWDIIDAPASVSLARTERICDKRRVSTVTASGCRVGYTSTTKFVSTPEKSADY